MNTQQDLTQGSAPAAHPASEAARLVDAILTPLLLLINARLHLLGALLLPLHARITRAKQRLIRLLTRLATGRYPNPRAARPGPAGRRTGTSKACRPRESGPVPAVAFSSRPFRAR